MDRVSQRGDGEYIMDEKPVFFSSIGELHIPGVHTGNGEEHGIVKRHPGILGDLLKLFRLLCFSNRLR